jgi:hypothetical protein
MKAKKHIIQPHSREWYMSRLSKFSSSELHKLISEGKKKEQVFSDTGLSYIYEKVSETISSELPDQVTSASLEWGIMNETAAVLEFERVFKETVQTGTYYDLEDLFCGTPDGETITHILEVKCPYNGGNHIANTLIRDNASLKLIRKEYYWQVQANMWLSGKSKAYFISFDPRLPPPVNLHVAEILLSEDDMLEAMEKIKMAVEYKDRILVNLIEQYAPNTGSKNTKNIKD